MDRHAHVDIECRAHAAPGRHPSLTAAPMLVVLAAVILTFALPRPAAAAVGRGVMDCGLDRGCSDPSAKAGLIAEVADHLRASWVRQMVSWAALEPERGAYSQTYLANLDYTVQELHARGVKVMLTVCYTPKWASDSSFWNQPPQGFPTGYAPRYPIREGALDDFGATVQYLATRYRGLVTAYECWNEPNLWGYIYPQRTANDEHFAARTYLKYLKAFGAGVKRGDPAALVVAGATAPIGLNDRYRTSPQKFARFLRDAGAAACLDVYSHHPYTPGGTFLKAPDQPPNDPTTTVTLWNLGQLLSLFPTKPFYLTEYGYNTAPSRDFGGMTVTRVQQATYLRKAYAYAARFPQVKVLIWYLVSDAKPSDGPEDWGVYTGLRTLEGARKPSWFVFAGGNRLSIAASPKVARGHTVRVKGTLSNAAIGPVAGRLLELQARSVSGGAWRTVKTTRTGGDGTYRFYLAPSTSRAYRVLWRGVRVSGTRTVWVY